jgi:hypothetical protein
MSAGVVGGWFFKCEVVVEEGDLLALVGGESGDSDAEVGWKEWRLCMSGRVLWHGYEFY